jgi:hypothetical protein
MSVGPITLLICPIWGPMNTRSAPQVWAVVLPLPPPIDGLLVDAQPAWSPAAPGNGS